MPGFLPSPDKPWACSTFRLVIPASLPHPAKLHGPSRLHHVTLDTFLKTYYSPWGSGTSSTSVTREDEKSRVPAPLRPDPRRQPSLPTRSPMVQEAPGKRAAHTSPVGQILEAAPAHRLCPMQ